MEEEIDGFEKCSECGELHETGYLAHNYCPNCGARMDKEENDDE